MIIDALLIALVAGIGILDGRIFGLLMLERPLVTATLVGLILGDLNSGIIIGAQLELIWMGLSGIGAKTPPDVVVGGVIGTAIAIISGQGIEIAFVLAIPIAFLSRSTGVLIRNINSYFVKQADQFAENANFRGIIIMMWIPPILFFLGAFVPTFILISIGAEYVNKLIMALPNTVFTGLHVIGTILPIIGLALLLDMLYTRRLAVYFFIGFLFVSYFDLDIFALVLFGTCMMLVMNTIFGDKEKVVEKTNNNLTEGEIDFE